MPTYRDPSSGRFARTGEATERHCQICDKLLKDYQRYFCSHACRGTSQEGKHPRFVPIKCRTCENELKPHRCGNGLCKRCYDAARYIELREKKKTQTQAYVQANAAVVRARKIAWYERNRERLSAHYAQYRAEHRDEMREQHYRKRARKRGAFVTRVSKAAIYARDKGICQICHKKVAAEDVVLDHIWPLSRGGTHEPRNVQISHATCNMRKNVYGSGQPHLL